MVVRVPLPAAAASRDARVGDPSATGAGTSHAESGAAAGAGKGRVAPVLSRSCSHATPLEEVVKLGKPEGRDMARKLDS